LALEEFVEMWVTQTYLRSPDSEAKVHVYYLFEDYNSDQNSLTDSIQSSLAALGQRYGRTVTLYMPEPNSLDPILKELLGIERLWWSVYDRLPGLLILKRPLEDYSDENPESFYVPLCGDDGPIASSEDIAEMIQRVTQIADEQLQWEFANRKPDRDIKKNSDLFDAIEMKPGLWGFRVDLKRLLKRRQ
jgi:hypothetical protein